MKKALCAHALLVALLSASQAAVAGPVFGPYETPPPDPATKKIKVMETGPKGAASYIAPTSNGAFIASGSGTSIAFGPKPLNDPVPGSASTVGSYTFTLEYQYNGKKVTDYTQQTGDPAILQAAAFTSGIMVDSLFDWLDAMGYRNDTAIDHPDFFLVGGGDVYFAVDLAALGKAGNTFVSTWALGSIFAINAAGGLDAMPFYQFSSTPFSYAPGSGWTGGTPLAAGTRLSFDAFHATSVPEPGTLALAAIGLVACARRNRREVGRGVPKL